MNSRLSIITRESLLFVVMIPSIGAAGRIDLVITVTFGKKPGLRRPHCGRRVDERPKYKYYDEPSQRCGPPHRRTGLGCRPPHDGAGPRHGAAGLGRRPTSADS